MARNRSFRMLCLVFAALSIAMSGALALRDPLAGLCVLVGCGLLFLPVRQFARHQYRSVEGLSAYLERICAGEYGLDVRDNTEGELSILRNDIYKVTLTLREQAELLKKDKLLLADALSDISHQLKTPLTSMVVMTDLLSEPTLGEEKRVEFTRNIHMQLERMEWLLTSLLKLSKIDAGTVVFKKEAVDVRRLLQKATAPLLIPMELKNQTLHLTGEQDISFCGDLNWSAEALVNILKNCVEHTPPDGDITIHTSQNHIYTALRITDTGAGIAAEELPHVFRRFYKGKQSADDSVGIGLAMAKSIIGSQNGTIQVTSEPGCGTHFDVKFYREVV